MISDAHNATPSPWLLVQCDGQTWRGTPRICHVSRVRNQDILAKELTKGYAGRSLFSRHWRAQPGRVSPAWDQLARHALLCPPNHLSRMGSYLSLMGPRPPPYFLPNPRVPWHTTNRSHDADRRDEPDLAHAPDHTFRGAYFARDKM